MIGVVETYQRDCTQCDDVGDWWRAYSQIRFGIWDNGVFVEYRAVGKRTIARYRVYNENREFLTHAWKVKHNQVRRYQQIKHHEEEVYCASV